MFDLVSMTKFDVAQDVGMKSGSIATERAFVRPFTGVCSCVTDKARLIIKSFGTDRAAMRPPLSMNSSLVWSNAVSSFCSKGATGVITIKVTLKSFLWIAVIVTL